jgi:hypothetical protein
MNSIVLCQIEKDVMVVSLLSALVQYTSSFGILVMLQMQKASFWAMGSV